MRKYEFLPHTADEKFRAYGNSLEEAFENAAYALTDIITDHRKVESNIGKEFHIQSENKEALLYDFLEQFLFLLDSENFLLSQMKNLIIENNSLNCNVVGDNLIDKYDIRTHVKAITYQKMFVKEEDGKFSIQVIVDV